MGKDLNGEELGKGFSQRKDGRYNFRYVDRFGKRQTIYNAKLTVLKKMAKTVCAKDVLHLNTKSDDMTMNELFDNTINIYKKGELKESTLDTYRATYLRYVFDIGLGSMRVTSVTPLTVKKFFNELSVNYSQSICGNTRAVFLAMFDLAVLEGIVPNNFIRSLKILSKLKSKDVKSLSTEDELLFKEYCQYSYFSNLYLLILNTGLRIGEAAGLTLDCIDLKNKRIHVEKALQYKKSKGTWDNGLKYKYESPKGGHSRIVPLNMTSCNIIKSQLEMLEFIKDNKLQTNNKPFKEIKGFEDLLFLSRSGTPIHQSMVNSDIHTIVREIHKECRKTIKPFGVHVLRHTFATRCIEMEVKPNVLQAMLGHKNITTTMGIYVDTEPTNQDVCVLDSLNSGLNVNRNENIDIKLMA